MTAPSVATGLVACTRPIAPPTDLLDALGAGGFAWLTEGVSFVTEGVAARVTPGEAADALAAIVVDDTVQRPGTGPIAVGALPFVPTDDDRLTIPARITAVADNEAWVTDLAPVGPRVERDPLPSQFRVEPVQSRGHWDAMVAAVLDQIVRGELDKAVLAREVLVHADLPFDPRVALDRLRRSQAGCYIFGAELVGARGFVGASPELLVRRHGTNIVSRPVAGTTPRGSTDADDRAAQALLAASVKDGAEHRIFDEAVVEVLNDAGVALDSIGDPEVAPLATVSHLATTVTGHVEHVGPTARDLARSLHPTPAVGGTPRPAALRSIDELEPFDRGPYAGPVGWVGANGDGEWAVALRCAELDGTRARLLAGAGIVTGSDPASEWAETESKFEPMLQVLVQP